MKPLATETSSTNQVISGVTITTSSQGAGGCLEIQFHTNGHGSPGKHAVRLGLQELEAITATARKLLNAREATT